MISTIDCFKERLRLWKTLLLKVYYTTFQKFKVCGDCVSDNVTNKQIPK
jgi:hypothetical protein